MDALPLEILRAMDALPARGAPAVTQLRCEEADGGLYRVWKIESGGQTRLLKAAKEYEAEVYRTFLRGSRYAPEIYAEQRVGGEDWLLMEYVDGHDLCRCTRGALTLALDALISMQAAYWNDTAHAAEAYSFEKSLSGRRRRGEALNDAVLKAGYAEFLRLYETLPRTLCHDDLLPFNVRVCPAQKRAVLIDWEFAGILPYPVPLARLLAYGEESADALFYMTEADRSFAAAYYYENLLRERGVARDEWQRTLDCFLLYEYCEWVAIGNRSGETDGKYYRKYLPLALAQARKLL